MAITIRNKETEAMIREIGRKTGQGPSGVIRELAAQRLAQENNKPVDLKPPEKQIAERRAYFEDLREKYPPKKGNMSWAEIEKEMDGIFGENLK